MAWLNRLFYFFIVWWAIGVILTSTDTLPTWLEWANAVFLYTAGIISIVYVSLISTWKKGLLLSIFIMLLTISVESLGVHYGILFGDYHYEKDFGIQLLGVPITIGFAWVMVVFTSMAHVTYLFKQKPSLSSGVTYVFLTGLLAVVMDGIIDPVAYKVKQYWIWDEGGFYYDIPTSNFIGWFVLSSVAQIVVYFYLHKFGSPFTEEKWRKRAILVYRLILIMFSIIALVSQLWLAVVVVWVSYFFILFVIKRGEKDD